MVRAARRRVVRTLQRLGLADPIITSRDALRRAWHAASDRVRCAVLVRRASFALDQGVVVATRVRRDGTRRAVLARVREDHRACGAVARNRELAEHILNSCNVSYHDAGNRLVVAADARPLILDAAQHVAPHVHHEVRAVAVRDDSDAATQQDEIVVFEHTVAHGGSAMYEIEVGCRILLAGAPQLDEDAVDFPVDVVYTWVDGNDPEWRARRAAALGETSLDGFHPEAASRARYESIDELRYSLRSVERFAEFVRHVFIVTDGQSPAWLATNHPGLTVVDHREIFPDESCLPVFNSHAIEARLHHIPGLSDHYLYLNDDFLFGSQVTARDFFDPDGTALVFQSRAKSPIGPVTAETKPVDAAAINVRFLVQREFGGDVPLEKFKHAPYAQRKSVYSLIEERFGPELEQTVGSRVRSRTDIAVASSLHQHVALATDMGRLAKIDSAYVDLGQAHLRTRLDRLRRTPMPKTVCINDSDQGGTPRHEVLRLTGEFFEAVYPGKSGYER